MALRSWHSDMTTLARGLLAASVSTALLGGCASSVAPASLDRTRSAVDDRVQRAERRPSDGASADDADLTKTLDRDAVTSRAVARSPALLALAHRARAALRGGTSDGVLPAPELGGQVWNLPMIKPYAVGEADMYMLELRQRFPPGRALGARQRAAAEEAEALLAELASEERVIAERASSAYADYAQGFSERRLQERQLALLARMGQAVRARIPTGALGVGDVARVELEVSRAERAIARIQGDVDRSHATLNALLRRPAGAPLGEPAALPPETVRLTLDELYARAAQTRGAVLSSEARLRAAQARREAEAAEADVPEYMLGAGYMQVPSMRPGVSLSASMSLPWLWGPGRHRVRRAEAEEAAERASRDEARVAFELEIGEALTRLRTLEAQHTLVQRRALPAAHRSLDALTAAFPTGGVSLLEWVDISRSVIDLEVELVTLSGDLARGVGSLERAVGAPLPRSPVEAVPPP